MESIAFAMCLTTLPSSGHTDQRIRKKDQAFLLSIVLKP